MTSLTPLEEKPTLSLINEIIAQSQNELYSLKSQNQEFFQSLLTDKVKPIVKNTIDYLEKIRSSTEVMIDEIRVVTETVSQELKTT
jgi:hypothetical protein